MSPPSATRVFSIFSKKKTLLSVKIDQISPPPFCKTCFSTSESFWHAKNNLVSRHQEVGLGQTPPPKFGNFSHIIPFFSLTTILTVGKGLISAESADKCICCAKVFSCRKSLKVHMVTIAEGRLSSCQTCANPSSSGHNLKMHMIAQAQALPMQTLKTFVLKQTM